MLVSCILIWLEAPAVSRNTETGGRKVSANNKTAEFTYVLGTIITPPNYFCIEQGGRNLVKSPDAVLENSTTIYRLQCSRTMLISPWTLFCCDF